MSPYLPKEVLQALIAPVTFFAFYQSPDDYHGRWIVSSFLRLIRMMSFVIAFTLPAVYIATISFHSAILPIEPGTHNQEIIAEHPLSCTCRGNVT